MKDLYEYVNGAWLATHVIPEDRGIDGTFHTLRDEAEDRVHEIVVKDKGLAGTLFDSFMDTEAINKAGISPLEADLDLVDVSSMPELIAALGTLDRLGVGSPVGVMVEKDSTSTTVVAYVMQSGLGLPDEAYYRDKAHAETLKAYEEHIAAMLEFLPESRLGGATPQEAAARIVALEKRIAAGHWDVVTSRDVLKTYNPTAMADLPQSVQALLRAAGLREDQVIAMMPSYVTHLDTLLIPELLEDWKLWALWHILSSRAGVLAENVGAKNFEFFGTRLSGATKQRDRWKRAVGTVSQFVGDEIGKIYVEQYFSAQAKERMEELVAYLIDAYRERLSALPWMTESTKKCALEKLEKFHAKIGYPEKWRSFEGLEFSSRGEDLVENVRRGSAFVHDYELGKLGKEVDREEWFANPQTVNAFYHPVLNDITFPAAILRPPFFDFDADAAENFGAIGAVIGHEIGHGFDDQGSRYDGDGNLHSWWTDDDQEAFAALTGKLVDQYSGLVPTVLKDNGIDSSGVNGQFTLGENIGDLGGLGIAMVAYHNWVADHGEDEVKEFTVEGADPDLEGRTFTGVQRFFLAWARVWRTAIRPELAQQYLAIDPHSPAEFRCNVIAANVDEFYEAFPEVDENSPMYLAPEDRVTIW